MLSPSQLNATALASTLNTTKQAIQDQIDLKLTPATVDPAASRFTGTITCFVDDATGDVVGLQLGSAPALCSRKGSPRSFAVPDEGHVGDVKVAVDKETGLVGELVFVVASNGTLAPTRIFSCGKKGGIALGVLPELSALAWVDGGCKTIPATNGRRLTQADKALDPGALRWTVTTLTAPPLTCDVGWANCNGNPLDRCETDLRTNTNCGDCGNVCTTGQACVSSVCASLGYRHVRWTITARRGNANSVQASEIQLLYQGQPVANQYAGVTVTNPGGSNPGNEAPPQGHDNDVNTKWLDFSFSPSRPSVLIMQFPATTTFDAYTWFTANDAVARDPVSWTLAGSNDGVTYATLNTQTNVAVTTARKTQVGPFPSL